MGLVTIKFSKSILKVENLTLIDNTVLNVTVHSPYPNDNRDLNITFWNATLLTTNLLQLQLKFKKPLVISS
jgi:hypothetical protein